MQRYIASGRPKIKKLDVWHQTLSRSLRRGCGLGTRLRVGRNCRVEEKLSLDLALQNSLSNVLSTLDSAYRALKVIAMNDAGNHVEPVPVNNPLQQVVDRQDEQIKQLKETNKEMKEQLKQKDMEVISVHSYDIT